MKHWPLPKLPEYLATAKSADGVQITVKTKLPGQWFARLGLRKNNIVAGSFVRLDKG
jgi:hypothetical protein